MKDCQFGVSDSDTRKLGLLGRSVAYVIKRPLYFGLRFEIDLVQFIVETSCKNTITEFEVCANDGPKIGLG